MQHGSPLICGCNDIYGIFIDGDNINSEYYKIINNYILTRGCIIMKKVYGDFTEENMKSWKKVCLEFGIEPIITWRIKKKNSSDIKMTSDLMSLLLTHPHIYNFVIVTGDIDLHEICRKIISERRYVIGISCFENSTSRLLKNNCSEFLILEHIYQLKPPIPSKLENENKEDIIRLLSEIISYDSTDGGMNLGLLKKKLIRFHSSFHEMQYGHKSFLKFIESCPEFKTEELNKGDYFVKLS